MTVRLISSGLVAPRLSAALDHALLEGLRRGSPPSMHIYRRPPTVSMGYFQRSASLDRDALDSAGVTVLRRMSGGGTICNDHGQLIYTLALPAAMVPQGRGDALLWACGAVADALRSLGGEAEVKEPNDVLLHGKKVSGNAQIRGGGSVALQGTLIIEKKGCADILGHKVGSLRESLGPLPVEKAEAALAASFSQLLGEELRPGGFSRRERDRADELLRERYDDEVFIWGR